MMKKHIYSTKSGKFWTKLLRSPCFSKQGKPRKKDKEEEGLRGKLNVNEEYKEVFRTKSYVEIWSKVQVQLTATSPTNTPNHHHNKRPSHSSTSTSSSSSSSSLSSSTPFSSNYNINNTPSVPSPIPFYMHLSDGLLEPSQDVAIELIKSSKLQTLLNDYFEVTLEAYTVCEMLLRGIHKTRSNNRIMKRVIRQSNEGFSTNNSHELLIEDLSTFARQSNPLSIIVNGAIDFQGIHDKHARLLRKLNSKKGSMKRVERFTKLYKKAAGYGFLIAYTALAVALLALAMHSVVGLLGVPGILLPFSTGVINKVRRCDRNVMKTSLLQRLGAQLDVSAKGAYILINDFDTVGRLVTRLHDEVEHQRAVAAMCVRNERSQEVVKEALRELDSHEGGFVEQLQELEEHIYLCFLTINRSRRLVTQQILAS